MIAKTRIRTRLNGEAFAGDSGFDQGDWKGFLGKQMRIDVGARLDPKLSCGSDDAGLPLARPIVEPC